MPFAIISDVHGNLEALDAVLKDIRTYHKGDILFLGDSVGYGPEPGECIKTLRDETRVMLAGNHDWAVIGRTDIGYFNPYARSAIEWTMKVLSDEDRSFLEGLPVFKRIRDEDIFLVHSTPKEPEEWHYLITTWDAHINFYYFDERICLLGHSHQPVIIERTAEGELHIYRQHVELRNGCRYIVNVGSVGQPRDGNPQASYALLGRDYIEIKRVSYDILSTQRKMREAGLPEELIERLARGR
ncbi:MAG: metallophosphoesterase family protein [Thermodesulfovibrionia bacterium]